MDSFHRLLIRADAAMRKTVFGKAAAAGLSSGQPKLLEYLYLRGDADQKTIAAGSGVEPATAGTVLARMEEGGLIIRRRSDSDKRAVIVRLTEKGKKAAELAVGIFGSADSLALNGIDERDIQTVYDVLEKVCVNLQREVRGNDWQNNN